MRASKSKGFTLIELMITIAVVAIGLALAYPSFTSVLRSNQVATRTNELIASFYLARTEAVRSNRGAGVCPSADGANCNGVNWGSGWLVFTDQDGDGALSADGDTVVRFVEGSQNVSLTSIEDVVAFDNRGRLAAPVQLSLESTECPPGASLVRNLTVTRVGQVQMQEEECSP